jgi:hypothetical protein
MFMGTYKRFKQCRGKSCDLCMVLPLKNQVAYFFQAKELTVHHSYVFDFVSTDSSTLFQTGTRRQSDKQALHVQAAFMFCFCGVGLITSVLHFLHLRFPSVVYCFSKYSLLRFLL